MILSQLFEQFVEKSPVSVMVRGLLERALNGEKLDAWYERTAIHQYTRELLFSSVFDFMRQVVFCTQPSIHAAYQKNSRENIGTSLVSVYSKLNGLEARTSAELSTRSKVFQHFESAK